MLPWKLRKRHILPASPNRLSVYFSLAKFQLVSCNLSLAMIWQRTYTHELPKLCSATLTSGICALRLWIKMDMLIAYHGMARGSPCVVPSWDKIFSPPQVNNLEGLLYMLMIYMDISGQVILDVSGVNQQDFVYTTIIKNLGHGVHGGFGTRTVASTNLQGTGCQLDRLLLGGYGLANYSSQNLSDSYWSNLWALIQWNEPSGRVAFQPQRRVVLV